MTSILLTCEHASASVPPGAKAVFASQEGRAVLRTHRAFDPGALDFAKYLKVLLQKRHSVQVPLLYGDRTRLLVDLNRTARHRSLLSEYSRRLSEEQLLLQLEYHTAYQASVRDAVKAARGPVLHLSIHSFTPIWDGEKRATDVGLLYDPSRARERGFATHAQALLRESTALTVHKNAPYRGISDGLPTWLRKQFTDRKYGALEIELNQRLIWPKPQDLILKQIADCLLLATT